MCLAEQQAGTGELVLADVAYIESEQDELIVSTMFGETKVVEAKIHAVDFMKNTVTLRRRESARNV